MGLMACAGLEPRIDAAGNIFGRRRGGDPLRAPILVGSHLDSVRQGGEFDGVLGVMAALGVIEACDLEGIATQHPLEMVVWAHSEPLAFNRGFGGSHIATGEVVPGELDAVWSGMRRADAIRRIGGDPERLAEAAVRQGSVHAYLELHIEQGPTLERLGVPIGIVEGFAGIERYEVTVRGASAPSGSTPIDERRDALVAASHLTVAVREAVVRAPSGVSATVDQFEIAPNAPGVVPGDVRLAIEVRAMSDEQLRATAADITQRITAIGVATGTSIVLAEPSRTAPVAAAAELREAIERAASSLRLKSVTLPSRFAHDAQVFAKVAPVGMIFVPSVGGLTHVPEENTTFEQCGFGADVLLRTVLDADRSMPDR